MAATAFSRQVVILLLAVGSLAAQVITPMELTDVKVQRLQAKYLQALMAIGSEIQDRTFPYPFYFSRVLDLDRSKMTQADQRSIRFDYYKNQTVLEITGNYYASYSADKMGPEARLKKTFDEVVIPILQAEIPHFPDDSAFSAFAIEVSHHVRQRVMNLSSEQPENVTVIIPVGSAQKLVDATNDDQRQAAILDSQIFLNGEPYMLWVHEGPPPEDWKERATPRSKSDISAIPAASSVQVNPTSSASSVSKALLKPASTPMRILTPEALTLMQAHNQEAVQRMAQALNQQAHFVPYAPPAFIGFRQGAYLQLSLSVALNVPAITSRYKLAALAFDEDISHLVRPLLEFFPGEVDFDGVDFSSSIHLPDGTTTTAVEFFFPIGVMRCFAAYDCTGQQLLDSGTVVMNGERAKLDLEIAEGKN